MKRWRIAARLAVLLLAAYAVLVEPRWTAQRDIGPEGIAWTGPPLRVAIASDWHFTNRSLWRVTTVERAQGIVAQINAASPDVVLLLGDLVADVNYTPSLAPTAADEIALVLGQLRAPRGVYAVLGNHDWWHGGKRMAAALERHGIHVLENQAMPLGEGNTVWLAGIGDHSTGHARPVQALAGVPAGAPLLAMMHDPAALAEIPGAMPGLFLAGHTHGGQIYLPGIGAPIVPGDAPRGWAYGWVEHAGKRMYVTSGLGVSIFPVRLNMRPEWVLFTLGQSMAAR